MTNSEKPLLTSNARPLIQRLRARRDIPDHSANNGWRTVDPPMIELEAATKIEEQALEITQLRVDLKAAQAAWNAACNAHETRADEGFQARVYDWMAKCFMRPDSMLPVQRSFRFVEEALELAQASGTSREEVLRLVDYVYGRPPGVISQEIGGVMVTLSGLATSFGLSMEHAGNAELARCDENTEKIRAKDLAKPQRSPLPGPTGLKASESRVAYNSNGDAYLAEPPPSSE